MMSALRKRGRNFRRSGVRCCKKRFSQHQREYEASFPESLPRKRCMLMFGP